MSRPLMTSVTIRLSDLCDYEYRSRYEGECGQLGELQGHVLQIVDGESTWLFVTLDLIELYEAWLADMRLTLSYKSGVPGENIIILCNHIHASPETFGICAQSVGYRIANALVKAPAPEPFSVGMGSVDTGQEFTMDRRVKLKGELGGCLMFNDGCEFTDAGVDARKFMADYCDDRGLDLDEWMPENTMTAPLPDTRLEMIRFRGATSEREITLLRFPCHPVVASHIWVGNTVYPDFIGALRGAVVDKVGGEATFVTGPCGNAKPRWEKYGAEEADKFGAKLGEVAVGLLNQVALKPCESFTATRSELPVTLRPEYQMPRAELEAELEDLKNKTLTGVEEAARIDRIDQLEFVHRYAYGPSYITPAQLEAGKMQAKLAYLAFNDIELVLLPSEMYNPCGQDIWQALDCRPMVVSLHEAYLSYVIPEDVYPLGSYEANFAGLVPGSYEKIVEEAIRLAKSAR